MAACFLQNLTPYEFVESMKKKGIRVPGIGHRYTEQSLYKLQRLRLFSIWICLLVIQVVNQWFDFVE